MHIIIGVLFIVFYSHAAKQCKKMQVFGEQPAKMGFMVFSAKTLLAILSTALQILLMMVAMNSDMIIVVFHVLSVMNWILFLALVCAVLCWRQLSWAEEKKPLQFVGIAIILEAISMLAPKFVFDAYMTAYTTASVARMMPLLSIVTASLGFLAYGLLLKAMFAWRGYPADVKLIPSIPAAPVTASMPAKDVQPAPPAKGMFEEVDYIPYISGVMLIGGLIAVPIIWGSVSRTGYLESIIPSLVSCALFAFAHDKRGNFNLGRFFLMFLYVLFMMMKTSAQYGARGGERPFFLAGGLLGYFVMFFCGWAGIKIGRLYHTQFNARAK